MVGCRSDGPRSALCDLQVVQNPLSGGSSRDFLILPWPQPDLLPREQARGAVLRNIVFKGDLGNLHEPFRSPEFRAALDQRGLRLVLDGKPAGGQVSWGDYREADLVLAARNLTERDAWVKPASKLLNAWHAGVPALLGPEPAFRQLRRSELDYIEVRTPQDALAAIDRLLAEPGRYLAMIEQSARRAPEYNEESIAARWLEVLEAAGRFLPAWQRVPRLVRSLRLACRAVGQKVFNYRASYYRWHGRRILDS